MSKKHTPIDVARLTVAIANCAMTRDCEDPIASFNRGWNAALKLAIKVVLDEEFLTRVAINAGVERPSTDRAASIADYADRITRHPSIEADYGR